MASHSALASFHFSAPGLPPTGASHQTLHFWLMIDVSLVILIALLAFALDDLAINSTPSSIEIRLRMHLTSHLGIYTKE